MKRAFLLTACTVLALVLGACLPQTPPGASATLESSPKSPSPSVVLPSPTQTGTIQWFPATRTPLPIPTVQMEPTREQRPGLGDVILSDDFTNASQWTTGENEAGTVSTGDGDLTMAMPVTKGMLISLRKNTNLNDFYLEVTSSLNLCRGDDQYGLLFRASSLQDYYRVLISCAGQVRLERIKNGSTMFLHDWTYSGQVPPGSPLVLKLGVWAAGSDLRLFINDVFQFSTTDNVLPVGSVGMFARSSGQNPLTVSFSDLKVYAVDRSAIPTPAPSVTITPTITRTPWGPTKTATPVFMHTSTQKP